MFECAKAVGPFKAHIMCGKIIEVGNLGSAKIFVLFTNKRGSIVKGGVRDE